MPAAVASVGDCERSCDPDVFIGSGDIALARPKSSTLTLPSGVIFTFAGFRSRWTMPFSCASASASEICFAIAIASSVGSAPRFSRCERSSPSTSSIASAITPSLSSSPWMAAMLVWFSDARICASRRKRATRSASCAKAAGSTLIATSRPSFVSRARSTSPMPPAPIAATTS